MTWGTIIEIIRQIHLDFFRRFPYLPRDLTLVTRFEFPKTLGLDSEWDQIHFPPMIREEEVSMLELHPVERVLLEGPLSPNEQIPWRREADRALIWKQVLMLEREWLAQMQLTTVEPQKLIENAFSTLLKGEVNHEA